MAIMAKTSVTLEVKSLEVTKRQVMELSYDFTRFTDPDGQVSSALRGGKITMKLKARNKSNLDFLKWIDSKEGKSGTIYITNYKGEDLKKIEFKGAFCVSYSEEWKEANMNTEKIILSCKEIKINETFDFERDWF